MPLEVRARARLCHADGADQLAARKPWQPAFLLCFGPMVQHVVRAHAVHALPEGAQSAARQLGVHHRLVTEIAATAAVFGRDIQQQQPGLAGLAPGFAVDVVLLAPARVVREHFGFDEAHHRVAKHFEIVVHPGNDVGVHACKGNAPGAWCESFGVNACGRAERRHGSNTRRRQCGVPRERVAPDGRGWLSSRGRRTASFGRARESVTFTSTGVE